MTISAGSPFTPMDPHGHDTFDCTKTKAGGLISPSWPRAEDPRRGGRMGRSDGSYTVAA